MWSLVIHGGDLSLVAAWLGYIEASPPSPPPIQPSPYVTRSPPPTSPKVGCYWPSWLDLILSPTPWCPGGLTSGFVGYKTIRCGRIPQPGVSAFAPLPKMRTHAGRIVAAERIASDLFPQMFIHEITRSCVAMPFGNLAALIRGLAALG